MRVRRTDCGPIAERSAYGGHLRDLVSVLLCRSRGLRVFHCRQSLMDPLIAAPSITAVSWMPASVCKVAVESTASRRVRCSASSRHRPLALQYFHQGLQVRSACDSLRPDPPTLSSLAAKQRPASADRPRTKFSPLSSLFSPSYSHQGNSRSAFWVDTVAPERMPALADTEELSYSRQQQGGRQAGNGS